MQLSSFLLFGIALPHKTSNENEQAMIDCGKLWQQFTTGNYFSKIPGKISEDVYAVYHDYEGDFTKPYAYFIGCKVKEKTILPEGLERLQIEESSYEEVISRGKMPDCVADAWRNIWQTDYNRAYAADFEIYGAKSNDWNNAEVAIFLSVK